MTTEEILALLEEYYPSLLTADGLDDAILGIADGWYGDSHHEVVGYDYYKCVDILVAQGMDEETANEFLQHNTLGAYVGEFTPIFLYNWRRD